MSVVYGFVVIAVLCLLAVSLVTGHRAVRRCWYWVTSRVAVEVRRAFPVRRDGKHTVARLDDQWADKIRIIADEHLVTGDQTFGTGLDTWDWDEPQPIVVESYDDPLREHIDAAWAYTGTTEAGYWADTRSPNQRALLWKAREVMPARVIAALERAKPDDTVIGAEHDRVSIDRWIDEVAGGALDQNFWARFEPIEARAREQLGRIRFAAVTA